MNGMPDCLLYTQDAALAQRMQAYLSAMTAVRALDSRAALERAVRPSSAPVFLLDIRAEGAREHLPRWRGQWPRAVWVVFAEPNSEPARDAEVLGVFAVEGYAPDRRRFQCLMRSALEQAGLLQELDLLRQQAAALAPAPSAPPPPEGSGRGAFSMSQPLRHFSRALRQLDNVDALLEHIVEGVANAALVARVGLFARTRDEPVYRLRTERQCLDETRELRYDEGDPLVRWLEVHAHLICRSTLEHLAQPGDRMLFARALDAMGAEVLVPLFARGRLLGWFFVGHRAAGRPFVYADLEDLAALADPISTSMENGLLYEEIALQKTLAETLLHSIPTGIVAVGSNGVIRWFNRAAERILEAKADEAIGGPAEKVGGVLADRLRRALAGEAGEDEGVWQDARTGHYLAATVRPLTEGGRGVGAMAMIENVTERRRLEEKNDQLERTAFWTELAAAMSHEIRNPLVAIQTFAQLLPTRHDDPEFRDEFSRQVMFEVGRLNKIIDQMHDFAHPPDPVRARLDFGRLLQEGLDRAAAQYKGAAVSVQAVIRGSLPPAFGDEHALAELVSHLVLNALEALGGHPRGRVEVVAEPWTDEETTGGIRLTVSDNGPGIAADLRDKVFSPFCTTKPRGMGLGLSIVKRTVIDHNGRIEIDSHPGGVAVIITLPPGAPDERWAPPPSAPAAPPAAPVAAAPRVLTHAV